MVVSPRCLERGPSSTPSHHPCEGRPPAFQASRAKRATHSAVASAACLEGRPGPVTPSTNAVQTRRSGVAFLHLPPNKTRRGHHVSFCIAAKSAKWPLLTGNSLCRRSSVLVRPTVVGATSVVPKKQFGRKYAQNLVGGCIGRSPRFDHTGVRRGSHRHQIQPRRGAEHAEGFGCRKIQ